MRPGDRVMIAAENTVACVALLYATQLLQAYPAILNPRAARAEVAALRACCAPRLTVFAVEDAPAAEELPQDAVDRYESVHVGTLLFGPVANEVPEPVHAAAEAQVGLLIFTSGTLGLPKAVMWSLAALANLGRVLAKSRMTAEVEAAINALAEVLQCGVVGLGTSDNEEIVAFVQLRRGATLSEENLQEGLREWIAPYKRPTRIEFVDALPLGQTGKIWKVRLQQMASGLPARSVELTLQAR